MDEYGKRVAKNLAKIPVLPKPAKELDCFADARKDKAKSITTAIIRDALKAFCSEGRQVSNVQIYQLLEVDSEVEKDRVRSRINDMVRSKELKKIGPGVYSYNSSYVLRENKSYTKMWRYVRSQKPGWTMTDMAQITGVHYTQVSRYVNWLFDTGYVQECGKKGTARAFVVTQKGQMTPETPNPPHKDSDPFERERAAAAKVATLMLTKDPYSKTTAGGIVDACKILLNRFASEV